MDLGIRGAQKVQFLGELWNETTHPKHSLFQRRRGVTRMLGGLQGFRYPDDAHATTLSKAPSSTSGPFPFQAERIAAPGRQGPLGAATYNN